MCEPIWEVVFPGLQIVEVKETEQHITVHANVEGVYGTCPKCNTLSHSVHSYRRRRVLELPCVGCAVVLDLQIRRWRCCNEMCSRSTFTEVGPGVIESRRHRTTRLQTALTAIGMELGGQAGHRLTMRLAMPTSGSTRLRWVRRYRRSDPPQAPVAVGIDDWALRRGKQYGSILVDLERHRPIGLLASRASPEVIAWLSGMRSPQIRTRDRSTDYQCAVSQVWPNARQVADRWHLLKNLHKAVERVFASHLREVRQAIAGLDAGHFSRYAQSRWRSTTDEARRHTAAKRRPPRKTIPVHSSLRHLQLCLVWLPKAYLLVSLLSYPKLTLF